MLDKLYCWYCSFSVVFAFKLHLFKKKKKTNLSCLSLSSPNMTSWIIQSHFYWPIQTCKKYQSKHSAFLKKKKGHGVADLELDSSCLVCRCAVVEHCAAMKPSYSMDLPVPRGTSMQMLVFFYFLFFFVVLAHCRVSILNCWLIFQLSR